jgi:2-succinyl-5-enolpyruvyl-6-hydroxy-3-cyclohexene-1-carboxylate synthase
MMISDKCEVQDFLEALTAGGITDIVLSPGSRNAPFSISLYGHPAFRVIPAADERVAGFIALGRAQQSGKPVVLICTSGTAILNYGPAIAEAYYQRIPMIVASADRPPQWVDQGEGQTIRQSGVFRNFTRFRADLSVSNGEESARMHNAGLIRSALDAATGPSAGPVHLNFPFEEPLYGMKETYPAVLAPRTSAPETGALPAAFLSELATARKVLFLCGQLPPQAGLTAQLADIAARTGAAVMTESHSNLAHPSFITTIDRLITGWTPEQKEAFMPDMLITIGSNIISRRVKSWLRAGRFAHWRVDEAGEEEDTYRRLTGVIRLTPGELLSRLPAGSVCRTDYDSLRALNAAIRRSAAGLESSLPFSDFTVTARVMRELPEGWDIQMGNSSVVRYIQLFDSRPDVRYFGNRGVSGIDGVTSTAIGAASASGRPTLLVTGDIAFLYDSNAFWSELRPANLRIVVIHNGGGGIFRIIDGPSSSPALEAYFETAHTRSALGVAGMYGIPARTCDSQETLGEALQWLWSREELAILEIRTPQYENDAVLKTYFRTLQHEPI